METVQALFKAAQRKQRQGDWAEARRLHAQALDALQRAVEREPGRLDLIRAYARALRSGGQLVLAQDVLSRAVRRFPAHAELHLEWGDTCMGLEDFSGAEAAYRRAWELDPAHQRPAAGQYGL